MKKKFTIEYVLSCTAGSLFRAITTETGLRSWFADRVVINGDKYEFFWSKTSQVAHLINLKSNSYVRFRWEDVENYYFEIRINQYEMTRDITLTITDFADDDEKDDQVRLWNVQIEKLQRAIGCPKK